MISTTTIHTHSIIIITTRIKKDINKNVTSLRFIFYLILSRFKQSSPKKKTSKVQRDEMFVYYCFVALFCVARKRGQLNFTNYTTIRVSQQ